MKKRLIPLWIILAISWIIFSWNYFQPFMSCPSWYKRTTQRIAWWKVVYCENNNWEQEWFSYSQNNRGEITISQSKDDKVISSIDITNWFIYSYCNENKCERYEKWKFSFKKWLENLLIGVWSRYWTGALETEHEIDENRLEVGMYKTYNNWILTESWTFEKYYTKTGEWMSYDNSWILKSIINYSWGKYNWPTTYYYRNWKINVESFYKDGYATWVRKWYDKDWKLINTFDYNNIEPLNCEKWYQETRDYASWVLVRQICKNSSNKQSWIYRLYNSMWELSEVWTYKNDKKVWKIIGYSYWWTIYSKTNYSWGVQDGEMTLYFTNWEISGKVKWENWKKVPDSVFYYYEDWKLSYWVISWVLYEYYENWNIKTEWAYDENNEEVWTRKYYEEDWNIEEMVIYNHGYVEKSFK